MSDSLCRHYHLTENPFGRNAPTMALHQHAAFNEARQRLRFTIELEGRRGALILVEGAAKTSARRARAPYQALEVADLRRQDPPRVRGAAPAGAGRGAAGTPGLVLRHEEEQDGPGGGEDLGLGRRSERRLRRERGAHSAALARALVLRGQGVPAHPVLLPALCTHSKSSTNPAVGNASGDE